MADPTNYNIERQIMGQAVVASKGTFCD